MKSFVVIKTEFEALHCWPECPFADAAFLKTPHRHIFYVVMKWLVTHSDRDIEFIRQKRIVEGFISYNWRGKDLGAMSCEMLAEKLLENFKASFVSVFEDNENGAEVHA